MTGLFLMIPVYKVVQPHKTKNRNHCLFKTIAIFDFVLEAGLEPAQPQWRRHFKAPRVYRFHHSTAAFH